MSCHYFSILKEVYDPSLSLDNMELLCLKPPLCELCYYLVLFKMVMRITEDILQIV